jgi:hypothetical protein
LGKGKISTIRGTEVVYNPIGCSFGFFATNGGSPEISYKFVASSAAKLPEIVVGRVNIPSVGPNLAEDLAVDFHTVNYTAVLLAWRSIIMRSRKPLISEDNVCILTVLEFNLWDLWWWWWKLTYVLRALHRLLTQDVWLQDVVRLPYRLYNK